MRWWHVTWQRHLNHSLASCSNFSLNSGITIAKWLEKLIVIFNVKLGNLIRFMRWSEDKKFVNLTRLNGSIQHINWWVVPKIHMTTTAPTRTTPLRVAACAGAPLNWIEFGYLDSIYLCCITTPLRLFCLDDVHDLNYNCRENRNLFNIILLLYMWAMPRFCIRI